MLLKRNISLKLIESSSFFFSSKGSILYLRRRFSNEMIPVIDLQKSPQLSSQIVHQACVQTGFFYLKNHGISEQLLNQVFSETQRLFALPESIKLKYLPNKFNRGYGPFQEEKLDSAQTGGDLKEGFYIGKESRELEGGSPIAGPNVWPVELGLEWRSIMMKYFEEMKKVGFQVVQLLALSLDLPKSRK